MHRSAPTPSCAVATLLAAFAIAALPVSTRADQILEVYGTSLTSFKPAGVSASQLVRPLHDQRGVDVDGSARSTTLQPWAFNGDPFGNTWSDMGWMGDVRLSTGTYSPTEVDIALPAQVQWVIGRSFNGRQESSGSHANSNGFLTERAKRTGR